MIHRTKYSHGAWHFLLCALVAFSAMLTATSCGDDEPTTSVINYYIDVEEEFLVNGATEFTSRYYSPVDMLKEVIRNTYPTPNAQGDDLAVIAACDELHQRYYSMYTGREDHLTCLVHLVRIKVENSIIRQSEELKTYSFDVNPVDIPQQGKGQISLSHIRSGLHHRAAPCRVRAPTVSRPDGARRIH